MKIKCEYCGSMFSDTLEKCPNCGATSSNMTRTADHTPKTIAELKRWYEERNLPPYETTRFFIGINYTKPKAFGIYEENGEFIVYKNKDTGERAIRYRGTDEAYAVNELYLKLKSEILNQKSRNLNRSSGSGSSLTRGGIKEGAKSCCLNTLFYGGALSIFCAIALSKIVQTILIAGIAAIFVVLLIRMIANKTVAGPVLKDWKYAYPAIYLVIAALIFVWIKPYFNARYFMYDDNVYVSYHNDYYQYDGYDYDYIDDYLVPDVIINHPADYEYTLNNLESWNSNFTSFYDSDYYDDHFDSSSDYYSSSDSDYDWDSGSSWDSGGSDWGSDW